MNHYINRLKKLNRSLRSKTRFPYLIADLNNIRYLTGFTGSYAFLLVDEKDIFLISDSRYSEYAEKLITGFAEFILLGESLYVSLKNLMKSLGKKELYLEENSIKLSSFLEMKKKLKGIKLTPGENEVNTIRMVKDDHEIEILKKAAELTDNCIDHLLGYIKPGMLEWDIAIEIENFYKRNGCRSTSFDVIVAAGSNSSMPHYETSFDNKVEYGDVILIDMGCVYNGYNSDLTRTIFMGNVDPEIEKIYRIVKDAQETAIKSIKPGISTGRLDSIARDIIEKKGYGGRFGHSLGHGVGIEVHEMPAIKKHGNLRIKKNMVLTIEPGIYLPGSGGVRIEDMVLVTGSGHELLTKSTKEIMVIK